MSLRTWLNNNSAVGALLGVVVLVIAGLVLYQTTLRERKVQRPQVFFSVDDGQSYLAESIDQVAPWPHPQGEAVRAFVFVCGEEKPFVAYLEKYTPEARQQLLDAIADPQRDATDVMEKFRGTETLVKRPGDAQWLTHADSRARAIRAPRCPDGSVPRAVLP